MNSLQPVLRVTFVSQGLGYIRPPVAAGSVAIWTYAVARNLSRKGIRVVAVEFGESAWRFHRTVSDGVTYIYLPTGPCRLVNRLLRLARVLATAAGAAPASPAFASAWHNAGFSILAAAAAAAVRSDVIHVHNFSQFVPIMAQLNPRSRIVLHMHCEWLSQLDRDMVLRRLVRASAVIGCSRHVVSRARECFSHIHATFAVVPNGVEIHDAAESRAAGADRGAQRILFVGRVSPEKGVHVLIDAFALIADRFSDATLDIVGGLGSLPLEYIVGLSDEPRVRDLRAFYTGTESYYEQMLRRVPPRLKHRLNLHGPVPHGETAALYRSAALFAVGSFSEAFCMPAAEAMAAGVPVVASRVGGLAELVEDGESGLLVEPGDVGGFADSFARLLHNPRLRETMGAAGRQRAQRLYSWNAVTQALQDAYATAHTVPADRASQKATEVRMSEVMIRDDFTSATGLRGPARPGRSLVDTEGIVGIDNGALRIASMDRPGWARHGVHYGPLRRHDGLVVVVNLLNGHNGSQTSIEWAPAPRRIVRAMIRTALSFVPSALLPERLRTIAHPPTPHQYNWPHLRDNLMLGLFAKCAPRRPTAKANGFLIRAAGIDNGTILASVDREFIPVVKSAQNIPRHLVIVARSTGAAYYVDDTRGRQNGHRRLIPVAIDGSARSSRLFAAMYQSILGEIGFRADTRVYGVRIATHEPWRHWYGAAHAADTLNDPGPLDGATLETGQSWRVYNGGFASNPPRAADTPAAAFAVTFPADDSGLVRAIVKPRVPAAACGLVWRARDRENFWASIIAPDRTLVYEAQDGRCRIRAQGKGYRFPRNRQTSVWLTDIRGETAVFVNGEMLLHSLVEEAKEAAATGVGIAAPFGGVRFLKFEAHPRSVLLPEAFTCGVPWSTPDCREVVTEEFHHPAGPLSGCTAPCGGAWQRDLGEGEVHVLPGRGARVRASRESPNPGRTIYTIPWDRCSFAELETTILPPGVRRGDGHKSRAGVVFFQDPDNYIIVNTYLDDWRIGKSISAFLHWHGREDPLRAVWTNVGQRIHWGRLLRLRVAFDTERFMAYVDNEPVLFRALSDIDRGATSLSIRRVGIAVNWEYGNDTGSLFERFSARRRER